MRKIIYDQLMKCKVARLPSYDMNTTKMKISKLGTKDGDALIPGHYYIIKLDDVLLSKDVSFVLHQNWNNNIFPQSNAYKCECIRIMGGMLKIEGIGFDLETNTDKSDSWGGWLPMSNVEIVREI